ncbi:MAG TPA: hypothetical protein VNL98_03260 [Gemmatimonadales bacterium]|nr:hypothetical protein [Gemmatimonadales bacterium]
MLLPLFEGLVRTTHFDYEMARLADRHYSRRTPGARQFAYSGRKLVLRDVAGLVLFVWIWPRAELRMDGRDGFHCAIFRNESTRRSSDIILEAEAHAARRWGPNRAFTFVDPRKVASPNPGYCFKAAGWRFTGRTKSGLHVLEKTLAPVD